MAQPESGNRITRHATIIKKQIIPFPNRRCFSGFVSPQGLHRPWFVSRIIDDPGTRFLCLYAIGRHGDVILGIVR
jgi:hypothetical protein